MLQPQEESKEVLAEQPVIENVARETLNTDTQATTSVPEAPVNIDRNVEDIINDYYKTWNSVDQNYISKPNKLSETYEQSVNSESLNTSVSNDEYDDVIVQKIKQEMDSKFEKMRNELENKRKEQEREYDLQMRKNKIDQATFVKYPELRDKKSAMTIETQRVYKEMCASDPLFHKRPDDIFISAKIARLNLIESGKLQQNQKTQEMIRKSSVAQSATLPSSGSAKHEGNDKKYTPEQIDIAKRNGLPLSIFDNVRAD